MNYKDYTTEELWKEITIFVDSGHYSSTDKALFIQLIEEFSKR